MIEDLLLADKPTAPEDVVREWESDAGREAASQPCWHTAPWNSSTELRLVWGGGTGSPCPAHRASGPDLPSIPACSTWRDPAVSRRPPSPPACRWRGDKMASFLPGEVSRCQFLAGSSRFPRFIFCHPLWFPPPLHRCGNSGDCLHHFPPPGSQPLHFSAQLCLKQWHKPASQECFAARRSRASFPIHH